MQNRRTLKKKYSDWMADHNRVKVSLDLTLVLIVLAFSAFIFAVGFKLFLNPSKIVSEGGLRLVSGGASGIAQVILEIVYIIGKAVTGNPDLVLSDDLLYSVFYFALNVPVFLIAFFGIGKRFALLTIFNVALASVFTNLLGLPGLSEFMDTVSNFCNDNGGMVARALFAGVCTGVSSGLAFRVDASAGGIDVISYWISLKKNVLVGRYSILINILIVISFTLAASTNMNFDSRALEQIACALYSFLYMLTCGLVIDLINRRNKKVEVEVITDNADLGKILIANLPHAATISTAKGAYTDKEHFVVQMVISSYEVKQTIEVVRESDPKAFVKVIDLHQVYGRFFLPPIR